MVLHGIKLLREVVANKTMMAGQIKSPTFIQNMCHPSSSLWLQRRKISNLLQAKKSHFSIIHKSIANSLLLPNFNRAPLQTDLSTSKDLARPAAWQQEAVMESNRDYLQVSPDRTLPSQTEQIFRGIKSFSRWAKSRTWEESELLQIHQQTKEAALTAVRPYREDLLTMWQE